jgi:hypothetical protein
LLAEFLSLPGFANLAYYVAFAFVALLLSTSYSIIKNSQTKVCFSNAATKNLVILGLLILPITPYLMSTVDNQPKELSAVRDTHLQSAERIYLNNTSHVTLPTLFSLTALPPLYEKLTWFNYQNIYLPTISTAVGITVASIIVIILAIRLIFFRDGIIKNMYPFIAILAVICILLLRESGYLVLHNSPILLLAFRDPYHKFETELALVLIIVFSYCVQELFKLRIFVKHNSIKTVPMAIVGIIIIYWSWPFITGNFVPTNVGKAQGDLHSISAFTDVPFKYAPAVKYLNQDNEVVTGKARVLLYPLANILWCDGNGDYWGNDILRFSGISTISTMYQVNFQNESNFISSLSDSKILSDPNYASYIKKLGIKYIIVRKQACDVDNVNGIIIDIHNQSKQIEQLLNDFQFTRVMENQYYTMYKIAYQDLASISIIDDLSGETLIGRNKFGFSNANAVDQNAVSLLARAAGEPVTYQKISSTEYVVNIKNNYKPTYLLFSESYDEGWKAFINGKDEIPGKYHLILAGFANGWYLNKTGQFSLRLYFQPQKYHDIGMATYIVINSALLIYILYTYKKAPKSNLARSSRSENK